MGVVEVEVFGRIGVIWLNRPNKRNALGSEFWEDFPRMVASLDRDPDVAVICVLGRGTHFCSGLDLVEASALLAQNTSGQTTDRAKSIYNHVKKVQNSITALADATTPTIAAVQGYCIGGGLDLIAAADIRLCTSDAIFSLREVKLAMVADLGSLQRLPHIVSKGVLFDWALTGRNVDAAEAQATGLVNRVIPLQGDLLQASLGLANEIASNSSHAVDGTKAVLQRQYRRYEAEDLQRVALWSSASLNSSDLRETLDAFTAQHQQSSDESQR